MATLINDEDINSLTDSSSGKQNIQLKQVENIISGVDNILSRFSALKNTAGKLQGNQNQNQNPVIHPMPPEAIKKKPQIIINKENIKIKIDEFTKNYPDEKKQITLKELIKEYENNKEYINNFIVELIKSVTTIEGG